MVLSFSFWTLSSSSVILFDFTSSKYSYLRFFLTLLMSESSLRSYKAIRNILLLIASNFQISKKNSWMISISCPLFTIRILSFYLNLENICVLDWKSDPIIKSDKGLIPLNPDYIRHVNCQWIIQILSLEPIAIGHYQKLWSYLWRDRMRKSRLGDRINKNIGLLQLEVEYLLYESFL